MRITFSQEYNKQKNLDSPTLSRFKFFVQKKASYLHHTATTIYLCCVPALEDSTGAGCVGLAGCKDTTLLKFSQ